jgi:hypothetical protein
MLETMPLWLAIVTIAIGVEFGIRIGRLKVTSFVVYALVYPIFMIKDFYACCFYQCLGFGTKGAKVIPIFKVKTNVVYLGLTFISRIKAKRVKHA